MTITEYLNTKYGKSGAKGMMAREARIFGMPYPLESGWPVTYGEVEITPVMLAELRRVLSKGNGAASAKGLRALNIIEKKVAPSLGAILESPWSCARIAALT